MSPSGDALVAVESFLAGSAWKDAPLWDQVEVAALLERVANHAGALQSTVVAHLAADPSLWDLKGRCYVAEELSARLGLSRYEADERVAESLAMAAEHKEVWQAMDSGVMDRRRARALLNETALLPAEQAQDVARRLLGRAPGDESGAAPDEGAERPGEAEENAGSTVSEERTEGAENAEETKDAGDAPDRSREAESGDASNAGRTTGNDEAWSLDGDRVQGMTAAEMREAARREVIVVDPSSAAWRHTRERRRRSVWLGSERDGMARISAFLPADAAMTVWTALAGMTARNGPDDPRPLSQRRADAFTAVFADVLDRGQGPDGPLSRRKGRRDALAVVVDAPTLLGLSSDPAYLAGYGPVPAEVARAVARDATWQRLLADPTGQVVGIDVAKWKAGWAAPGPGADGIDPTDPFGPDPQNPEDPSGSREPWEPTTPPASPGGVGVGGASVDRGTRPDDEKEAHLRSLYRQETEESESPEPNGPDPEDGVEPGGGPDPRGGLEPSPGPEAGRSPWDDPGPETDRDPWDDRGPETDRDPWDDRGPETDRDPWDDRGPETDRDPWDDRGPETDPDRLEDSGPEIGSDPEDDVDPGGNPEPREGFEDDFDPSLVPDHSEDLDPGIGSQPEDGPGSGPGVVPDVEERGNSQVAEPCSQTPHVARSPGVESGTRNSGAGEAPDVESGIRESSGIESGAGEPGTWKSGAGEAPDVEPHAGNPPRREPRAQERSTGEAPDRVKRVGSTPTDARSPRDVVENRGSVSGVVVRAGSGEALGRVAQSATAGGQESTAAPADDRSVGYRPPAWLVALIETRDRRCAFPGCRMAAEHCDLDHIRPFDVALPGWLQTTAENLAPLCRRHHEAKTCRIWSYSRDAATGLFTWTSPTGHVYTRAADPGALRRDGPVPGEEVAA